MQNWLSPPEGTSQDAIRKGGKRHKMKLKLLLVVFFGIAFLTIGLIELEDGKQLADNETKMMKGELLPFEIDSQKPVEIQFGGFHAITNMSTLGEDFNLRRFIDFDVDYPFQIRLAGKRLSFSVDMKNGDNETIATISDNQWGVKNDNTIAHDRNYNSYALEVIDSHLVPAIQIVFTPENKLYVGGLFYLSNGVILVATNDTTMINPSPSEINSSLPRIFEYPSEQHLGEMVVKTTYQVSRVSAQVIIIGQILTGLGILFSTITGYIGIVGLRDYVEKNRKQTGKENTTSASQWRNRMRRVFNKASSRAFAENKERKRKPDEIGFKQEAVFYAEQFALDEKTDVVRKQGATKGAEFYNRFKQTRSHVEKGENEEDLQKIVRKWYSKLGK